MARGTRAHGLVRGNALVALRLAVRGKGCDVHGSNLKVVSPSGFVTYSDAVVRRGPLADAATECGDPAVIVEVLSPSARGGRDLVTVRHGYQAIPSLRHLLYVYSDHPEVELVSREPDGNWRSVFDQGSDGSSLLLTLKMKLQLGKLYLQADANDQTAAM